MGYAIPRIMIIQFGSIQCNLMNIGLIYERGRSFDPKHAHLWP